MWIFYGSFLFFFFLCVSVSLLSVFNFLKIFKCLFFYIFGLITHGARWAHPPFPHRYIIIGIDRRIGLALPECAWEWEFGRHQFISVFYKEFIQHLVHSFVDVINLDWTLCYEFYSGQLFLLFIDYGILINGAFKMF